METATKALQGKPISQASRKEIKQTLGYVWAIIGLRAHHMPEDNGEEEKFLISFIIEQYGKQTLLELKLAFHLAIKGDLDIEPSEVKPYDMFSALYLGQIMAAYKSWLRNAYRLKISRKAPLALPEPQKGLSDEEWEEWLLDIYNYEFPMIPAAAYDYLVRVERIEETKEFMNRNKQLAVYFYKRLLTVGTRAYADFNQMGRTKQFPPQVRSELLVWAKRFALVEYFTINGFRVLEVEPMDQNKLLIEKLRRDPNAWKEQWPEYASKKLQDLEYTETETIPDYPVKEDQNEPGQSV